MSPLCFTSNVCWLLYACYRKSGERVGKSSDGKWRDVLRRVKNLPGIDVLPPRCAAFMQLCVINPVFFNRSSTGVLPVASKKIKN